MLLLNPELINIEDQKLKAIDETVKSIYRLIVFDKNHKNSDLLTRYLEAMHHLQEVLSIKNAQQEAQTEDEAREYLKHLQNSMQLIVDEIADQKTLETTADLFRLFRLIAPDVAARHPNHFRQTNVQFGPCMGAKPAQIPVLVSELFQKLPTIKHPVLKAIYVHHELVRIHPFHDGNGRLSRMSKNWMLMYDLYPPMFINNYSDKKRYIAKLQGSFLAMENEPETFHPATHDFFEDELLRIKASAAFILNRMLRNPNITFQDMPSLVNND